MLKRIIIFSVVEIIVLCIVTGVFSFKKEKSHTEIKGISIVITKTPTPTFTPTPTTIPSPTLTPAPTATPTPTLVPTPIIISPYLDELFTKYCNEYSIDKELLKRIANCESHFGTGANSKDGKYAGMFQFGEAIWIQTRNLRGWNPDLNLRFSAEESIKTAAFMVSQKHLGIWPNCGK